ncbi:hypothetical protein DAPPUDRAFT_328798 [Daphnia pulex]|uniref:MULE transposase domain-containing protein n=1 Tax=Daphnia pulex TaxID=6669 RepID=E9HET2_DAPPU|nr:hypothetical protein DAPPUDRAFT_328798 [Daphnia pulex]|eukprot:EFX69725.1 hypothetical protein DAPPUDRAFT_328798 [Daphnia pulex]
MAVNCVQVQFRQTGNNDCLYDFVIMDSCICEISITGRKPQIIECVSCRGFMHRQCKPVSLSSTEFVRMKKYKKEVEVGCRSRKREGEGDELVLQNEYNDIFRKNPLAAPAAPATPNPPRPTFLALPAAPGPFGTSSPMDIGSPAVFPVEVSPIDSLPLLAQALPEIRVEARVAVTFTITPPGENALHFSAVALAEWSSRYSIPLPLIENSAELLPSAPALVQPIPANAGPDDESSDDDEPREIKTLFDGLGHSYHIKRTSKISRTWRCNRHAKPHFCRGIAFEVMGAKSFSVKVPHTCPANLDVERDASLITKAKVNACSNPLVSSRKGVEKEMLKIFQRPFERCIPDGYFRADVLIDTPRRYARHLIFATDQQLHLLRKAKRWYGDGTFFICPTPFNQVSVVVSVAGPFERCIPDGYFRAASFSHSADFREKEKKYYVAVFASIFDLLTPADEHPKVKEFMMDFEAAMWEACKVVFQTVNSQLAAFHLIQSFYRNIKAVGLSPA